MISFIGENISPSTNFGMPSSTSTWPEDPFWNTTLGSNSHDDEEVYQDEDPIDNNNIPSDVQMFLVDPYNSEMSEKSIKENKTEIFLNLVKDGVNVFTSFDESTLFRQITKDGAPMLPTSNIAQTSGKEKEFVVRTSSIPTSSASTQAMVQLSAEHI